MAHETGYEPGYKKGFEVGSDEAYVRWREQGCGKEVGRRPMADITYQGEHGGRKYATSFISQTLAWVACVHGVRRAWSKA